MSLFKDRLREARLNRKMTQAELAERIGVVKSTIAGYEAGRSEPDMEKFALIMSVLNVDANSLLRDEMYGDHIGRVVPTDEAYLIALKYDELDDHGKQMIRLVLEAERSRTE
ncbi:MAG: helix-turn-helix transcriptional regulator [Clostridia bacterium]|nr:helix-turn-helix transcriptional regulator [Clostridia bacterium]